MPSTIETIYSLVSYEKLDKKNETIKTEKITAKFITIKLTKNDIRINYRVITGT